VYRLGKLYLEEDNTEYAMKGGKEARRWYEKAAVAGDSRAMYALGRMYYVGLGGAQDYQQARHWYEQAAVAGHRDAMWELAKMYQEGLGGPRDQQKAQQWQAKGDTASLPREYVFVTHDFGP